ncbi:MAG: hypothetical protein JWP02_905 [Acidimicrobiales bacterium]|nr:hypothetical protein [Acidimicrobiales bacterium]
MFTWVMASKGTHRLATVYLVVACVAFLLAVSTWMLGAAHHSAAGQTTLELHITRYAG